MADIAVVAGSIRPLTGAVVRRYTASGALSVGDFVYIDANGQAAKALGDTAAHSQARGIIVAVGVEGATAAVAGNTVDVVVFGPVELGVTGLTDGSPVYVSSATAGKADQTASATSGKFNYIIGWAEGDTKIFIQGQMVIPTVVP